MTVQLGDPGGNPIRMLLLFIRVLEKFGLDSFGVDSRRHVVVAAVTEHARQLGS